MTDIDTYAFLGEEEVRFLIALRAGKLVQVAKTASKKEFEDLITPVIMAVSYLSEIENKKLKAGEKLKLDLENELDDGVPL
jgi:energy-converting hydrogenase Eha subunit C